LVSYLAGRTKTEGIYDEGVRNTWSQNGGYDRREEKILKKDLPS
jgi:hypothetical protein